MKIFFKSLTILFILLNCFPRENPLVLANEAIYPGELEKSPISVDAAFDHKASTVGDLVVFNVTIVADPDIKPEPLDFNSYFKGFDILDRGMKGPKEENGQLKTITWYRLRADLVGKYLIPAVPVTFTGPDPHYPEKTIQGQILTPEAAIEVMSVLRLQGEPKGIRDIKPILDMDPDWFRYGIYGGVALMAFLLFVWWVKTQQPAKVSGSKQTPPPLTAHERAFKELHALKAKEWLAQGRFREYYFELSEIFRRYIGERYQVPALDWTSQEIKEWLDRTNILDTSLQLLVEEILHHTDQVKFAKAFPSGNVTEKTMSSIDQFIRSTLFIPQPEEITT